MTEPHECPPPIVVHAADAPNQITMVKGQMLIVALIEEPSKGLKWEIRAKSKSLALVDESKKTETSEQRREFRFVVHGHGRVNFMYRDPWKNGFVQDSITFQVVVPKTPSS